MQQLEWPNGSRVLWMAKSNGSIFTRQWQHRIKRREQEKFDEMKCIAKNQFVHTSIMLHAHKYSNKINGRNGMFRDAVRCIHIFVHKNLCASHFNDEFDPIEIPQNTGSTISKKEHRKENIFLHVSYVCDCANWYRKTNGNHSTVILSLPLPFIDVDCVTHLRDKKNRSNTAQNDKFQFFCNFVVSM